MNLCLLAVSKRSEIFPQPKNFKDITKGVLKLVIKAKKLKDYIEKENKKEKMEKGGQEQQETQNQEQLKLVQDIKNELGQIDLGELKDAKPQAESKKEPVKDIKKGKQSGATGGFDPRNYVSVQWVSGYLYDKEGSYDKDGSIHIYTDKHGNEVEAKSWIDKAGYVQFKVLKRTKKSTESSTQGAPP
jgi:hypothetical protein